MTDEYLKLILEELRKTRPAFGEWQLCPKCNGAGCYEAFEWGIFMGRTCDVCQGAKVIERPLLR